MASIAFTDSIGAATLSNGKPFPGDRFSNWVEKSLPYGETASRQSDGASSMFIYREDYGATFELRCIPSLATGSPLVAPVDIASRLRAHLLRGGTCSIATGDSVSSTYPTCGIWPDTMPDLTMSDPNMLEYSLTLQVLNLASSPVPMVNRMANQ